MKLKNHHKKQKSLWSKLFTGDMVSATISGVISGLITAAVLATFAVWYSGLTKRSDEAELLSKVGVGANKEYIDSILGVPVLEMDDFNELTNSFYPLNYTTVRCVYDDDVTVAFFVTAKSKAKVYRIPQNNYCQRNYLGRIKLSDIDYAGIGTVNVPAGSLEYLYYEEKMGGSHADNFNRLVFGIYGSEEYMTEELVSLGMGLNQEELTSEEISRIRQTVLINTYGEIAGEYDEKVSICPDVNYIGNYFPLLY